MKYLRLKLLAISFFGCCFLLTGKSAEPVNLELDKNIGKELRTFTIYRVFNKSTKQKIWQEKLPSPINMGFKISYFCNFYYHDSSDLLYVVITGSTAEASFCKVKLIKGVKANNLAVNGEYNSPSFLNLKYDSNVQILLNEPNLFLVNKNKSLKNRGVIFNTRSKSFMPFSSIIRVIAPYTTDEFITYSVNKNKLSKYQRLCAIYEKKMIKKIISGNDDFRMDADDVRNAISNFLRQNKEVKLTELLKSNLSETKLVKNLCNSEDIQLNLSFSNWISLHHRLLSEIVVSEDEINNFYNTYKWSMINNIDFVKNDITDEIKRLKYYRLDELLTNPPRE